MPVERRLPSHHFNSVIRWIKNCPMVKLESFRVMLDVTMERLEMKSDPSKSVKGIPDGSDATDFMSVKVWMSKLTTANKPALRQVLAFDATLRNRMEL